MSNYPKDSKYYNCANTLVIGKTKGKASGLTVKGFDYDELKYKDYKNVLFNRSYMRHEINLIQSKDYNTWSYRINKISLSS